MDGKNEPSRNKTFINVNLLLTTVNKNYTKCWNTYLPQKPGLKS